MNPRRVIFVGLSSGIFGNGGQTWRGIDLQPACSSLSARGFSILHSTIDELRGLKILDDDIIIYSSFDPVEVREYLKDILYVLRDNCTLIPSFDFLMAHENKGFQELQKERLKIGNLSGDYFYDIDDAPVQFPYVYKEITGAGSRGVRLVQSEKDLGKIRSQTRRRSVMRALLVFLRRFHLSKKEHHAYHYRHKKFNRFVTQEFVPNANCDYKVLVFGERFFVLKRYVRKGDFRASGSGRFDFSAEIPSGILDFAASISNKLIAPQLSLDIVEDEGVCRLIEYQALNFGPTTLTHSIGYFFYDVSFWRWVPGPSSLSESYAHSLEVFFDRLGITV